MGWIGSYLASKQLDTTHGLLYDNVASTVSNAQQFIANTQPYGPTGKFDYPSFDFTTTDDGVVRSLGQIVNDFNSVAVGPSGRGFRGARILKGSLSAGVFNWVGDSVPLTAVTVTNNAGDLSIIGIPHMCWNESGTIGFVWFIGQRIGATGSNRGFQPIVYKTVNSGASWSPLTGINFNDPSFKAPVLDHYPGVQTNTALVIPLFNTTESMDGIVDMNGHLHIMTTIIGTSSAHADSLGFSFSFTNTVDGETQYSYAHTPGQRPYIYDFTETTTGWNVTVVDSMSSEAPSEIPARPGFNFNKWDATGGTGNNQKVRSNASLQMSRTPDGKYIVYTWAESDTAYTDNGLKWNQYPDIKAKMMDVSTGLINPTKISITNPAIGSNPLVAGAAHMHHISPKCAVVSSTAAAGVAIAVPMFVSNNPGLVQLDPNTHWYSSAVLNFGNVPDNQIAYPKNQVL